MSILHESWTNPPCVFPSERCFKPSSLQNQSFFEQFRIPKNILKTNRFEGKLYQRSNSFGVKYSHFSALWYTLLILGLNHCTNQKTVSCTLSDKALVSFHRVPMAEMAAPKEISSKSPSSHNNKATSQASRCRRWNLVHFITNMGLFAYDII